MGEQRLAEEGLVELLRVQREALQADVAGMQASLANAHLELVAAKERAAAIAKEQARGRDRLLQSFVSFATTELGKLGQELDADEAGMNAHLDKAETLTLGATDAV